MRALGGVLTGALVLALLGGVPSASTSSADAGGSSLTFHATGYGGGGTQNVIAVSPFRDDQGRRPVIAGADVGGLHVSYDDGVSWAPSNEGLTAPIQLQVATVAFSPTVPGKVYAGVGPGPRGGLLVSADWGRHWTRQSAAPNFLGNGQGPAALPAGHPRSVGALLAFGAADGQDLIWAATLDLGVLRSADDGATWTPVALAPAGGRHYYSRGLLYDDSADTLYVATYGTGLWEVTGAGGPDPAASRVAGSPDRLEELFYDAGVLYVAANRAGILAYDIAAATWTPRGVGLRLDGANYGAITGVRVNDALVLYAGCAAPRPHAGTPDYETVYRSGDGGVNWTPVTVGSLSTTVAGASMTWWLSHGNGRNFLLDRQHGVASQIVLSPDDPQTVLVAGRAGIYRSSDAGGSWHPAVDGLNVTVNLAAAVDPASSGRVYVGAADWLFVESTDGMATVRNNRPPSGLVTYALAVDPTTSPAKVLAATADRGNRHGEVWSRDPATGRWLSLHAGRPMSGNRALALAVGAVAGRPIVLAAVENGGGQDGGRRGQGGIYRRDATGWHKVSPTGLFARPATKASLAWPAGSRFVYAYDPGSGVWRSDNYGAARSWTRVWRPCPGADPGQVAAGPGGLFVAACSGGYRLDGAETGEVGKGATVTRISNLSRPSALTLDPAGALWMTQAPTGSGPARIVVSLAGDPKHEAWTDVGDDYFRHSAPFVSSIAVDGAGAVYLTQPGGGVVKGDPTPVPRATRTPRPSIPRPVPPILLLWALFGSE